MSERWVKSRRERAMLAHDDSTSTQLIIPVIPLHVSGVPPWNMAFEREYYRLSDSSEVICER